MAMNVNKAISMYVSMDEDRGYESRRYPACVGELDGVVAIADEEGENGSSLKMYRASDFIAWMEEARRALKEGEYESLWEAINETMIEPSVSDGH